MDDKPFDEPVPLKDGVQVKTTAEARDRLASVDWPVRGVAHDAALDACLKVLDGHRSTIDAQTAFTEAAREAGLLEEKVPKTSRKDWAAGDLQELKRLAGENTPAHVIGGKLGRSESSIRQKASAMGISLRKAKGPHSRRDQ